MSLFSFPVQFIKYGEFHHNPVNQWIHMIFVPILVWTVLVFLNATPSISSIPYFTINGSFILVCIYSLYYCVLHITLGIMASPILFALLYAAQQFTASASNPYQTAIAIHFISWAFQIFGHAVFEGRAPAFTEDPLQALVLAPLFVFCEGLFTLGFYSEMRANLEKEVQIKVDAFNKKKK